MKPPNIERKIDQLDGEGKGKLLKAIALADPEIVAAHLDQIREGTAEQALQGVEVTALPSAGAEAASEQAWFVQFESRFNAHSELHPGVRYSDVKKALDANPGAVSKLVKLDSLGFAMNVFRAKNANEIQFRTAQTDVTQIAAKLRTIMYDKQAQSDYPQYKANGNAEDIAASMGVEIADKELYEQLRVRNGWVYLKTDADTRAAGCAFYGYGYGVDWDNAEAHGDNGSFCAALMVKKA